MEVLKQLLGRLHPIIVHLPIGFIIAALLLQWSDRKRKSQTPTISSLYLWASICAVIACITGYLQYSGEGYAFNTVSTHLWFGIITAVFAITMHLRLRPLPTGNWMSKLSVPLLSILMLLLIAYTGHLGGSITHGEDYLVEPLPNNIKSALGFETYEKKLIVLDEERWEEAVLYNDLIAPILNNNCVSCHNKKRAKGGLLLNSEANILEGGDSGEVIVFGKPEDSPLYSRLVLPEHHEDHMPPKDKPQPSKQEIALIQSWILSDASFQSSIGELGLPKELVSSFFPKKHKDFYPDVDVDQAPRDSINKVKLRGIHIQQLSEASKFLTVSCINKPDFADKDIKYLLPVSNQVAVLDLGGTKITDAIIKDLTEFKHLVKLKLDDTAISGDGISQLSELKYLKVINLTGTRFKERYLSHLGDFKTLEAVYFYNTGLNSAVNRGNMKDSILKVEFGNYELPPVPSDSIIY